MSSRPQPLSGDGVVLYWLPLGAGDNPHCVRWSGRTFEQLMARTERRERCDLDHSALEVRLHGDVHVIEMAPVWRSSEPDRGVVCEGPVGTPLLGHSRLFRYEVRCWRNGVIPDLAWAVGSPDHLSTGVTRAQQLLALVPHFPTATWGRDEMHAGDMWNSNSLISWLLARSGHDISHVQPPEGGRAPGWVAGLTVAARTVTAAPGNPTQQARAAAHR